MSAKLTFDTLSDLREAIAMTATAKGSAAARLARIQSMLTHSGDAAMAAGLPSGQFRAALTKAMSVHQTKDGKRFPSCVLCGEPVSDAKGSKHPAAPALITLVPSTLFADVDTLSEVSPGSAPRLGYLPGNVALACKACADWKASDEGRGVILSPDVIDADVVLMSWAGIKASTTKHNDDTLDSLARRKAARDLVLAK